MGNGLFYPQETDHKSIESTKRESKDCCSLSNQDRQHGCARCVFVITHNSNSFNLLNPNERHHAIQYLLQNVWISSDSKTQFLDIRSCVKIMSSPRIQVNLMQFEFIRQREQLSQTLSQIENNLQRNMVKSRGNPHHHHGLRNIMDVLISNELITKHIFKSNATEQIWKSLMFNIITILSFDIPIARGNNQWFELYTDFVDTIKFWRAQHILYFIQCKFSILISNAFRAYKEFIRNNYQKNQTAEELVIASIYIRNSSFNLYTKIVDRIKRIDKKGGNLNQLFHRGMDHYLPSNDAFFGLALSAPKADLFPPRAVHCGYPFCKRTRERFAYKCKCKRCKLIRYCSRKHQKKHWKLIHSQQCRPY